MKYGFEWTPGIVLLAMVIVLPLAPPFALIAVAVLALAVVAALVAFAAAVLASPYLLVRYLHRRRAEPRLSTDASGAVARVISHAGIATQQPGFAALANAATARGSR